MGLLQMKVPSPGESISEVEIAAWLVSEGDYVVKDQAIAEVDPATQIEKKTDKNIFGKNLFV